MAERTYHSLVDLSLGKGPVHIDPQNGIHLDPDGAVNPYTEQALRLSMGLRNSSKPDEVAALEQFTAGGWNPIELHMGNGTARYDVLSPSLEYYHGPYHRAAWHRSMNGFNISLGAEIGEGEAIHPAHAHPYAPELALRYCGTDGSTTTITPHGQQTFLGTSLLYYPPGIPHQDRFTGTERFLLDWKIPAVAARVALPDLQLQGIQAAVTNILQDNPYGVTRVHDALGGVAYVQLHQPESTITSYPGILTLVYPFSSHDTRLTIGSTHLTTSFLQPAVATGNTHIMVPASESVSIAVPIDPTAPHAITLLSL